MSPALTCYQNIVDAIYTRAKTTHFGCGEPEQSLNMADLSKEDTAEMAALTLINAFHAKYDLVALMQAAIEMIDNAGITGRKERSG